MYKNHKVHTLIKNQELLSSYQSALQYIPSAQKIRSVFYSTFTAKELADLTFSEVQLLRKYAKEPSINNIYQMFVVVFCIPTYYFYNLKALHFFAGLNYIVDLLKKCEALERKAHNDDIDDNKTDLQRAGIDKLIAFGDMNIIIAIAREFSTSIHEVERWKYIDVVVPFIYIQIESQVKNNLIKMQHKA